MSRDDASGRHWRADQLAAMTSALAVLLARQPSIDAALLATPDGFVLAAEALDPASMDRLAAMTSSLVALCDAVLREAGLGDSQFLLGEGTGGRLLMQQVEMSAGVLLLALTCRLDVSASELCQLAEQLAGQLTLDLSD
jgi:predicted regulator of Ras-like GTPase activity (Roadblock/LC7/MglB family)